MEWTPDRIRAFRDAGLCLSQLMFAKRLGFDKRTIGNAERGTHPPSLALRHALDQALEQASEAQRNRFLIAVAALQEDRADRDSKEQNKRHVASLPLTNSRLWPIATKPLCTAKSPGTLCRATSRLPTVPSDDVK